MEVSANVRRTEPIPRREQDGETYSAATRSRSTSTQPIAAPSTATHTSCSRIARATRSAAPRVDHLSACSLDIAGTASARMARCRILASASSSAASARRICIKSLPRGLTLTMIGRLPAAVLPAGGAVHREVWAPYSLNHVGTSRTTRRKLNRLATTTFPSPLRVRGTVHPRVATQYSTPTFTMMIKTAITTTGQPQGEVNARLIEEDRLERQESNRGRRRVGNEGHCDGFSERWSEPDGVHRRLDSKAADHHPPPSERIVIERGRPNEICHSQRWREQHAYRSGGDEDSALTRHSAVITPAVSGGAKRRPLHCNVRVHGLRSARPSLLALDLLRTSYVQPPGRQYAEWTQHIRHHPCGSPFSPVAKMTETPCT